MELTLTRPDDWHAHLRDGAALLTLAVAARLAFLLPLPGGWGLLEAGQVTAYAGLGGDPTVAMAACLIMRARDLVLIAAGAGLLMRWVQLRSDLWTMPSTPSSMPTNTP